MTGTQPRVFRLLLDSNVLFSAEPFAGQLEERFTEVAHLYRMASDQGHRVLVHPASLEDAQTDSDKGFDGEDPAFHRAGLGHEGSV